MHKSTYNMLASQDDRKTCPKKGYIHVTVMVTTLGCAPSKQYVHHIQK